MSTTKQTLGERARIIWAIASKDIVDAIKNKTTLTIMLGVSLLVLSSQAFPLLMKLKYIPKAYVVDPGESATIEALAEERTAFRVLHQPSEAAVIKDLVEAPEVRLGLIIPIDFDKQAESGDTITLKGYLAHWADQETSAELVSFFENQFSSQAGVPVRFQMQGNQVFPLPDSRGFLTMISTSLTVAVLTIGLSLAPLLMVEEKETHTMDALLVSPASNNEVVIGKAIAGTFYCLVAAAVVLLLNYGVIAHWYLAILAAICGSLFVVSFGLLIGMLFDNPININMWGGLFIVVLMVPVFLSGTLEPNLPPLIQKLLPWLPSVAIGNLIRFSFAEHVPLLATLRYLSLLVGSTILLLALVVWRVRSMDR